MLMDILLTRQNLHITGSGSTALTMSWEELAGRFSTSAHRVGQSILENLGSLEAEWIQCDRGRDPRCAGGKHNQDLRLSESAKESDALELEHL